MKNLMLSIILLSVFSGCISFSAKSAGPVTAALEKQYPEVKISREFAFTAGAWVIGLVDKFAFDDDEGFDISRIRRAEIGVYKIRNLPSLDGFEFPTRFIKSRDCPIKETIIKIREDDEYVLVLLCMEEDRLNSIYVVSIERRELVVVKAEGDYNSIIETVLKSTGEDKHFHRVSGSPDNNWQKR